MKKLFLLFLVAALFACNNESDTTDTINTDTVVAPQDNTMNRDTSMMTDTSMNRRDSL